MQDEIVKQNQIGGLSDARSNCLATGGGEGGAPPMQDILLEIVKKQHLIWKNFGVNLG